MYYHHWIKNMSLITGSLPKTKVKESEVAQSCPTLCDHMDFSPPGSSIHGIFQARVLEWIAISFSRGSSQPRDRTQVSCIAGRRFTVWASREALKTKLPDKCWIIFQNLAHQTSHPRLLPRSPKFCSVHLCLFFCFAYRVIINIFLNSIYMC